MTEFYLKFLFFAKQALEFHVIYYNHIQHEFSITDVHFFSTKKIQFRIGEKESQHSYYLGKFSPPYLDAGDACLFVFLLDIYAMLSYNVTHR